MLQVEFALKVRRSLRFLEETDKKKNWLMRVPGLLELTLQCWLQIIIVM